MLVQTKIAPTGIEVAEFERDDFLDTYWVYNAGERVAILGPSNAGKTVLGFQLLEATVTPKIRPVVFVSKPRDKEVLRWAKGLGYQITKTWPPKRSIWESRVPAGDVLWPEEDPDDYHRTLQLQYQIFHRALNDIYNFHRRQKGKPKDKQLDGMIAFADELAALDDELGLRDQIIRFYSRGRSNDAGMWGMTQLPIDVPGVVYSSSDHLFLAYMPDARYRKRFAEIGGGTDSQLIEETSLRLKQFEWLYIRRSDRTMCIIRA